MAGIMVAAKMWRWTPWEKQSMADDVMQVAGIAPSFRGVRINPHEDLIGVARDGRVLTGRQSLDGIPPGRHTTDTGGLTSGESAFNLIDTNTNTTKWAQTWPATRQRTANRRVLEWEWPRAVKADGVWLSSANDDVANPGRQPISWDLDAYLPGRGWTRVYEARQITPAATNLTWYGPFEFQRLTPILVTLLPRLIAPLPRYTAASLSITARKL